MPKVDKSSVKRRLELTFCEVEMASRFSGAPTWLWMIWRELAQVGVLAFCVCANEREDLACWRIWLASGECLNALSRPTEVAQSWKVREWERFKWTTARVRARATTSWWAACQMMDGKWWIAFYAVAVGSQGWKKSSSERQEVVAAASLLLPLLHLFGQSQAFRNLLANAVSHFGHQPAV